MARGAPREALRALPRGLALGALFALLDLASLASRGGSLRWLRGARSLELLSLGALAGVLFAALLEASRALSEKLSPRARAVALVALGGALGAASAVAGFTGSGVRRSGLAPLAWALCVLAGLLGGGLLARSAAARALLAAPSRGWRALGASMGLALYAAHARVLLRLYPGAHALAALGAALCLWWALELRATARPWHFVLAALASVGSLLGLRVESFRAGVLEGAPMLAYPARAFPRQAPREVAPRTLPPERSVPAGPGLALGPRDVLLVTVDALRDDALDARAQGAALMPAALALAGEGTRFRAAYCSTPHTSYSLASLLTGKYFRELSALPAGAPHDTLFGLLRRAGWRTAGYYPPALFHVDAERLGDLRARAFDLEHREENWDDARARVESAGRWLRAQPAAARVLLWVHLFEPHEPYEPPPEVRLPEGDSPRARYDRETVAVDRALARLRTLVREAGRDPLWVFTADHGEEFGEHGGRFHGTTVYEEQLRVPLVLAGRGLPRGEVRSPVSLVDVAPTVLRALGLAAPTRMRGRDLGPLARGVAVEPTDVFASVGPRALVRRGELALTCERAAGTCALYDLSRDPFEREDLLEERAAQGRELRASLERWSGSHGALDRVSEEGALPPSVERLLAGDRGAFGGALAALPTLRGGAARVSLRAVARAAQGPQELAAAREVLAARLGDTDRALALEAAAGLGYLGDARAREGCAQGLAQPEEDLARRAALCLARLGDPRGRVRVEQGMLASGASDVERDDAAAALLALGSRESEGAWLALLADPRMAPLAARALGRSGGAVATAALRELVRATRYALTRVAALEGLARAGDAGTLAELQWALSQPLALEGLGETFRLLSARGLRLRGAEERALGAEPLRIELPPGAGWLWLSVEGGPAVLSVGAETWELRGGAQERVFSRAGRGPVLLRSSPPVRLRRLLFVPAPSGATSRGPTISSSPRCPEAERFLYPARRGEALHSASCRPRRRTSSCERATCSW